MLDTSKYARTFSGRDAAEARPEEAVPGPQIVRPSMLAALPSLKENFARFCFGRNKPNTATVCLSATVSIAEAGAGVP